MKNKYLIVVLFSFLLVPSVAFASWWNPFSWFNNWTFHKTDRETQILEDRVKELEKKLEDTTTPATETSNTQSTATKPVVPTVSVKPVSDNQVQTEQYKKILLGKISEIYAIANKNSNYADSMIFIINGRINFLNSLISKNETFIDSISDVQTIKIARAFNTEYEYDRKISENFKSMQNLYRDSGKKTMTVSSTEAISVSSKISIPTTEFEKLNASYDSSIKMMDESSLLQEKEVSEYKSHVASEDKEYKSALALLKAEIDSMEDQIASSSQANQSNYIPPPVAVPIPHIYNCSFSSSSQWGQTTGHMECY
ncbi:MAG: hypothetical protein UR72_C0003G0033 [Parcubacteria group bacterium GW2011_GWC1_35_21]|nr:MAG: hypothetical protein UR72_C0003G0033 [Parcubacteria group bacterium GW2011_GWC1_35_21]